MSFNDRWRTAQEHEAHVLQRLRESGWNAGRADLIAPALREALMPRTSQQRWSHANVLRWTPDLFACRGDARYLVECKGSQRTDTPNFTIEYMSISSLERWYQHTGMQVVIVWSGDATNLHSDLLATGSPARLHDGRGTSGSGTPFYLWPKSACRGWDDVFGLDAAVFGGDPAWKVA